MTEEVTLGGVTVGVARGITGCDGGVLRVVTGIVVGVLGVQTWVMVGWVSEVQGWMMVSGTIGDVGVGDVGGSRVSV